MRITCFFRILVRLAVGAGVVGGAWAGEVRYRIEDLGAQTHAVRLNAKGEVALTRNTGPSSYCAVLFSEGKSIEIRAPVGTNSSAHDLNDAGVMVGSFIAGKRENMRFVTSGFRYRDGIFEDLSAATTEPLPLRNVLLIGKDGMLVAEPVEGAKLVSIRGAVVTPLSPPEGFQGGDMFAFVVANRVGPNSEILGRAESARLGKRENGVQSLDSRHRAVIFRNGRVDDADALGFLSDINGRGQIVGSRRGKTNRSEAFFFDGEMRHDLGIPGNFENSSASSINNSGVIVGSASTQRAGGFLQIISDSRAYVYRDGAWQDLNECVDLAGTPFSVLTSAQDINDRGQIIGQAVGPGGYRAYLLTPLSEEESAGVP